jgi:polyphosphate kinase
VQIDLIVRGICCLRPGIPGVSDNIRVISIVGQFLEHNRIYYFYNLGKSALYAGSADLMQRNIDRRVEVLFPIEDQTLREEVIVNILNIYLKESYRGYSLDADGNYSRIDQTLTKTEDPFNSQEWFLNGRITFQQQIDVTSGQSKSKSLSAK